MSIANEITNYANGLSDAYDAVNDMSGIIPQDKNMNNLDTAIRTIPQSTGPTYTAGNGIIIDGNDEISIDDTVVAELSDIGDGTLTIKRNGTTDETFTANSSTNVTVDVQAPVRVDLRGQCQLGSWRRSVIALCRVPTAANQGVNSYSSGRLTFQRDNGIDGMFYIDFVIDAKYFNAPYYFNFSYSSNVPLLGSTDSIDTSRGFRPCIFKKDNVWYGGIEFAASNTNLAYVSFYGESNFEIFGVDYYSWAHTSGGTTIPSEVLDQEIYDSIDYTTVYWTNRQLSAKNITVEDGTIRSIQGSNTTYTATLPTKSGTVAMTSDNVASATKLETARTIAIGTGATGTATSFNGTSNITIPVTDVKDAYVTWGGKNIVGGITPDDAGCIDEFGHNKLAFLPAECIDVAYTTDGGTTWTDYGLTDAKKIAMVTTTGDALFVGGPDMTITAANITDAKLRIRIAGGIRNGSNKLYTYGRKWLANVSTDGANDCKVQIRYRTKANFTSDTDTWTTVGTYDVAGWTGWNSIPWDMNFGHSNIYEVEFLFWSDTYGNADYSNKLRVVDLRLIGTTNWTMPSEMARAGHLYSFDTDQKATFPGEVVTNRIFPNADSTYDLGASSRKWRNLVISGNIYKGSNLLTLPNSAGTLALTSDIQDALIIREWS